MPEFSPYANVIFSRKRDFLGQMYPAELDIKYMTESNTCASYLVLLQLIGRDGHLPTSLYDKRNDLNFYITHVPALGHFRKPMAFLSHNWIPTICKGLLIL